MTLNEFKAWLEGYEHSFETNVFIHEDDGRVPGPEQWAEIKKRLATVPNGSEPVGKDHIVATPIADTYTYSLS